MIENRSNQGRLSNIEHILQDVDGKCPGSETQQLHKKFLVPETLVTPSHESYEAKSITKVNFQFSDIMHSLSHTLNTANLNMY